MEEGRPIEEQDYTSARGILSLGSIDVDTLKACFRASSLGALPWLGERNQQISFSLWTRCGVAGTACQEQHHKTECVCVRPASNARVFTRPVPIGQRTAAR